MKIGIIGAGYTGLEAAKELIKNGHEVYLLDKNSYVGGMANTVKLFNTRVEKYYRHIFKSDKEVINLVNELQLSDELIWPETKMGYYIDGKMYEFGTPISLLKFKPLNFIEKLRFGFNIVHIKLIKNYMKIEKYTAEEWLKKRIGQTIYSKIWEPLLISKFGNRKNDISMAWMWGKINLRSTSSNSKGEQLGYIKGSYEVLTNKLYEYLIDNNTKILLNSAVTNVIKKDNKYVIEYEENMERKSILDIDAVICSSAYPICAKILNTFLNEDEKEKLNSVEYTGARTMMLVSKKSMIPYYWLNIGDNSIPFGGIIEHTNYINPTNYDGRHIIYVSNYMTKDNKLWNLSKEELLKEYCKYFRKINSSFSEKDIESFEVYNEDYAQPIIECNYSERIIENKLKGDNIYIASMPQIYPEDRGLNYAIALGKKVAKQINESI